MPLAILMWWAVFVVFAYILFPATAGSTFFKVVASAVLTGLFLADMASRAGRSPLRYRILFVREISLFLTRGVVLIRKQIRDMAFWNQQHVQSIKRRSSSSSALVVAVRVQGAKIGSIARLSIGILQQTRLLSERFFAVVSARGGFPPVGSIWTSEVGETRTWYSGALGDLALVTLFALALWKADPTLVPQTILNLPVGLAKP
jgi:hypothetical protein